MQLSTVLRCFQTLALPSRCWLCGYGAYASEPDITAGRPGLRPPPTFELVFFIRARTWSADGLNLSTHRLSTRKHHEWSSTTCCFDGSITERHRLFRLSTYHDRSNVDRRTDSKNFAVPFLALSTNAAGLFACGEYRFRTILTRAIITFP